eukprot:6067978-Alexandrium_andersonii.AAC.1
MRPPGRAAAIGGPGAASGILPSLPLACMAGRSGVSPHGAGDAPPTGAGVVLGTGPPLTAPPAARPP